ncbi:hypothetical protein [Levilactobacillus yonginensis]|uniref:hypothetical protein n=1 Tax=Levilactobacillus yonginensis TaxID=1054041 RepID=UPI00345C7FCD
MNKRRKKNCKRLAIILIVIVVLVPVLFVPYTPTNAVRLSILENGHPIAAILSGPSKLPKSEHKYYSGGKKKQYYQINVPFSTESADVDVLVVNRQSKPTFYNKYTATLSYALGP